MKKIIAFVMLVVIMSVTVIVDNLNKPKSILALDESSFCENVSKEVIDADDTLTVIIQFDYPENDFEVEYANDLGKNQEILKQLRENNRAYYSQLNYKYLNDLDINFSDMQVSSYSPFVFVGFETWDEYSEERDEFLKLSEHNEVKFIYVEETIEMESNAEDVNINIGSSLDLLNIADAKKMIGINESTCTGEGIRVGIIESTMPDDITNFTNSQIKGTIISSYGSHSTKVASIIAGTHGIAPNAYLYFAGPFSNDAIEWLLSKEINVNIINMSSKVNEDDIYNGYYLGYDAYMDYVSQENNLIIVKSSGNTGNDNNCITSPGLGINVITVGSVDANKNISDYSSYRVHDDLAIPGIVMKPTLVAPGEHIIISNTVNSQISGDSISVNYSGTSFSAPMVTGIIALLMDEFENLILYPELITAALINGAEPLPGQTEIWDEYAGAGLVNYTNARSILSEQRYDTIGVNTTQSNSYVLLECTVNLMEIDTLTYCFFDSIKPEKYDIYDDTSDVYVEETSALTPNITLYQVKIFDSSGNVVHTNDSNSNVIVGEFDNTYSEGIFKIRVYMLSEKNSFSIEYLALTYSIVDHAHSYGKSYTSLNALRHRSYCDCGEYVTETHILSTLVGGSSRCIKCGYTSTSELAVPDETE